MFVIVSFFVLITIPCHGIAVTFASATERLFTDEGSSADSYINMQDVRPDPTIMRSRTAIANFDRLSGADLPEGAEAILLNLFDDVSLLAVKDRLERRAPTRYTWFGHIAGMELGHIILVVEDEVMAGNIIVNGKMYQVRGVSEGVHAIREINQGAFPDEAPPIPVQPEPEPSKPSSPSSQPDDGTIIDVLVVYTATAASNASPNIAAEIQLAIDETNQAYGYSEITQRVRLVHSAQVDYAETGDSETDLGRLKNPSDGYIDEVHTLRDAYGADVVSFWVESLDACGRGYLMTTISSSFASNAFSVIARNCATGNYSFGHEMGHNMGAHHDRYVTSSKGAYEYSHGYVYLPDRWRTIMAYNDECKANGYSCTRVQHFSNPNVLHGDVPTGISDVYSDSANNSLTLNNTAYTVANFRQSISPLPNLISYKPQGWSDKIVVSNSTGTNSDSNPLYTTDTLYVDFAVLNDSDVSISSRFYATLYVDGILRTTRNWDSLSAHYYGYIEDYSIGSLNAGTHTIKIIADSSGAIDESKEWDNEYTKTIYVQSESGGHRFILDYDGDGKTDVAVWRSENGFWYIKNSSNGTNTYTQWGGGNDIPVPGDYGGDGKTDIAVYRPSNGYWYIINSSNGTPTYTQWGGGNDIPVPGDYDGDGKRDVAVWRPDNGFWYIKNSSNGTNTYTQWGGGNDIPVPGDYDGDGKTDVAVWRPDNGFWYIKNSSNGTNTYTQWGGGNDIPVSQLP